MEDIVEDVVEDENDYVVKIDVRYIEDSPNEVEVTIETKEFEIEMTNSKFL